MVRAGQLTAFYLFDVADAINLREASMRLGSSAQPSQLATKPPLPAHVKYQVSPVHVDGTAFDATEYRGYRIRAKLFDYGVVSISFTCPIAGPFAELVPLAQTLTEVELESVAEKLCRTLVDRIAPSCEKRRAAFLSEDYVVFAVTAFDERWSADALITQHGGAIAQLLRAEAAPLSSQEREEVLRHRLSYLDDDLVVPTWNTALVYDTEAGVQAALEIFEYANSQLLQFRYYDDLLDERLSRIYDEIESTRHYRWWRRQRYTRPAREVHALFIDVNELTDRTDNALKLVGDVYIARLLALANSRLGVNAWRASVQEKLKTLDEIYRFAVDQTGMERGELLEIAIVSILIFELILFFLGIMK